MTVVFACANEFLIARQGCRALQVFACANEFLIARQGCRALQVCAGAHGLEIAGGSYPPLHSGYDKRP